MFRLKMALLSGVISGVVLVVFGLFFLRAFDRVGLERMDQEIRTLGESQLHVWHAREHWQAFGDSLETIYGKDEAKRRIVKVQGGAGDTLYQSAHWPDAFNDLQFEGFDTTMAPPRPRPALGPAGRQGHWPPPLDGRVNLDVKASVFETVQTDEGSWRVAMMGNQHITLMVGLDMTMYLADREGFFKLFCMAVALAFVVLTGGGWWLATRALKPVSLIAETAESMRAEDLKRRVPTLGGDTEFTRLVAVINGMLARLEKSFSQAIRFSADAAHELQTPLAILQGNLDTAIQEAPDGSEEQQRYGRLLEEVQLLKGIVGKLLLLARADANGLAIAKAPVNFTRMILAAAEDAEVMDEALTIETHLASDLMVPGDGDLLRTVVQALVTNAVKYNGPEKRICLTLNQKSSSIFFEVFNTGPQIPVEARPHLFDRFFRVDSSRSRTCFGTGLGLSLAREIVSAHGGSIKLLASSGNGTRFQVTLPLQV